MADFVFNISKGRVAELANRVEVNDPSTSVLWIIPVDVAAVSDATIKDFATLSAVLAGGVTERTTGGWNRKTLTDTDITGFAVSNASDWMDVDITVDPIWTAVTTNTVTDLIICYEALGAGTTANMIPLTQHDFAITPDGSDVTAVIAAAGFFRAT